MGTTLYALGDTNVYGVGHFRWQTGPLVTRYVRRGSEQVDIRTTSVFDVFERGYWVMVTGTVDLELKDKFADPLDVVDSFEGKMDLPGAMPYSIHATFESRKAGDAKFVVVETIRQSVWMSIDCLK